MIMEEYNLPEDIWKMIDNIEEQDDRIAQELDIYSCPVDTLINSAEGDLIWK